MSQAAHQERLMTVIRGPHLSEKSHIAAENNQIVFKVRHDATKSEIRQAVELLFEVDVDWPSIGHAGPLGIVRDRQAGTVTAVVRVCGDGQFGLIDPAGQD